MKSKPKQTCKRLSDARRFSGRVNGGIGKDRTADCMKSAKYRPTAHLLEQEIGKDRIVNHAIFHTKHKNLIGVLWWQRKRSRWEWFCFFVCGGRELWHFSCMSVLVSMFWVMILQEYLALFCITMNIGLWHKSEIFEKFFQFSPQKKRKCNKSVTTECYNSFRTKRTTVLFDFD